MSHSDPFGFLSDVPDEWPTFHNLCGGGALLATKTPKSQGSKADEQSLRPAKCASQMGTIAEHHGLSDGDSQKCLYH
jgi:hypothetical protein